MSVGWSKDCHKVELDEFKRTKLPDSRRSKEVTGEFNGGVDQIEVLKSLKRVRPEEERESWEDWEIGVLGLADQTTDWEREWVMVK